MKKLNLFLLVLFICNCPVVSGYAFFDRDIRLLTMQYDTCRYTFNLSIGITLEDEEEITVNPRQQISIRPIWK